MKSKRLSESDTDALLARPLVATPGKDGQTRITPVWFRIRGGRSPA